MAFAMFLANAVMRSERSERSMTRAGIEPATYGLTYHFGFRRPR
jgi:hypothetical protein